MKTEPQLLIVFSAFSFFAHFMDINKENEIDPKLLSLFKTLARLCKCSEEELHTRAEDFNKVIKALPAEEVDFVLLSVSILAEYYQQLKGKKRYYTPMSHDNILELQEECLEDMPRELWVATFDYAEKLVKLILRSLNEA